MAPHPLSGKILSRSSSSSSASSLVDNFHLKDSRGIASTIPEWIPLESFDNSSRISQGFFWGFLWGDPLSIPKGILGFLKDSQRISTHAEPLQHQRSSSASSTSPSLAEFFTLEIPRWFLSGFLKGFLEDISRILVRIPWRNPLSIPKGISEGFRKDLDTRPAPPIPRIFLPPSSSTSSSLADSFHIKDSRGIPSRIPQWNHEGNPSRIPSGFPKDSCEDSFEGILWAMLREILGSLEDSLRT